jgi:hypothetical protein
MSKLSTLLGKSEAFNIGGIELEIKARTLEDINLFMDFESPDKRGKALQELIKRTLKDAVPEATEEELKSFSFKYFKELIEAILKVNGLSNANITN